MIALVITSSNVFAQTSGPAPNDLGNGSLLSFRTQSTNFMPGSTIEIQGNSLPNSAVSLVLFDPTGISVDSASTFSDRDGQFSTILKIPKNASGGIWKIDGKSDNYKNEITFSISLSATGQTQYCCLHATNQTSIDTNSTNSTGGMHYDSSGPPIVIKTPYPLQQLRHGIAPKDVNCLQGLHLIFKSENGSPACVKPNTAQILIDHGWAKASQS